MHFFIEENALDSEGELYQFLLFFVLLGLELLELGEFIAHILFQVESRSINIALRLLDVGQVSSGIFAGHLLEKLFLLLFFPERELIFGDVLFEHDADVLRSFVQTPQILVVEGFKEFIDFLNPEETG